MVNMQKVAVIGCGFVGATSAFSLIQTGLFSEMVLIDANAKKAEGEAMDLQLLTDALNKLTPQVFTYDRSIQSLKKGTRIIRKHPLLESGQGTRALEALVKDIESSEHPVLLTGPRGVGGLSLKHGGVLIVGPVGNPQSEERKVLKERVRAVNALLETPLLRETLLRTGQLPIRALEERSGVPRKILERHRKYLVAAVILLAGDYPGLAEYLRYIRKEPRS